MERVLAAEDSLYLHRHELLVSLPVLERNLGSHRDSIGRVGIGQLMEGILAEDNLRLRHARFLRAGEGNDEAHYQHQPPRRASELQWATLQGPLNGAA